MISDYKPDLEDKLLSLFKKGRIKDINKYSSLKLRAVLKQYGSKYKKID